MREPGQGVLAQARAIAAPARDDELEVAARRGPRPAEIDLAARLQRRIAGDAPPEEIGIGEGGLQDEAAAARLAEENAALGIGPEAALDARNQLVAKELLESRRAGLFRRHAGARRHEVDVPAVH